jgi:hypothetical protein
MTVEEFGDSVNTALWILGNVTILLIVLAALVFSVLYPILFNPRLTSGGQRIWEAIGSVAGIGLLVVVGLFIDSDSQWWATPDSIVGWWPLFRLVIFSWVAYTFGRLVVFLIRRRFWPEHLKTRDNSVPENTLEVRPRQLRKR